MNNLTEEQILKSSINRAYKKVWIIAIIGIVVISGFAAIIDVKIVIPAILAGFVCGVFGLSIPKFFLTKFLIRKIDRPIIQEIIEVERNRLNKVL